MLATVILVFTFNVKVALPFSVTDEGVNEQVSAAGATQVAVTPELKPEMEVRLRGALPSLPDATTRLGVAVANEKSVWSLLKTIVLLLDGL